MRMLPLFCVITGTVSLFGYEYVPNGAQRMPQKNCVFHIENNKGLYKVPHKGFMVKFAKNKWRKVHSVDHEDMLEESGKSVHGFLQMGGLFLVHRDEIGKLSLKTYWPNWHVRLFTATVMEGMIGEILKSTLETAKKPPE